MKLSASQQEMIDFLACIEREQRWWGREPVRRPSANRTAAALARLGLITLRTPTSLWSARLTEAGRSLASDTRDA